MGQPRGELENDRAKEENGSKLVPGVMRFPLRTYVRSAFDPVNAANAGNAE